MPRASDSPPQNRLLAALSRRDYRRLADHLEVVPLRFGEVLHEAGGPIRHVYFPYGGLVSLLAVAGAGKAAEAGIVGNEGAVGVSAALGIDVSHLRAVVQAGGTAARIPAARLRESIGPDGAWHRELFRCAHALMNQFGQTAVCNRFHRVEKRLARWLLATRDRLHSSEFRITQEFMSLMLGVRRVGVTEAAINLQKRRLIRYRRGHIHLLDPAGLEAAACGCYRALRDTYRRTYS